MTDVEEGVDLLVFLKLLAPFQCILLYYTPFPDDWKGYRGEFIV